MLTVAIPKRNKLQNIIVLTPKDGGQDNLTVRREPAIQTAAAESSAAAVLKIKEEIFETYQKYMTVISKIYFTDVA